MKRWLALLLISAPILAFAACGGGNATQTVTFANRIVVQVPADMQPQGLESTASPIGHWTNGDLELSYDVGPNADPLGYNDREEFRISLLTIAGKDAVIEYFHDRSGNIARPWVAALHIGDIGNGERLTIFVRSSDEDGQDVARRIFRSIELLTGGSGSSS